MKININLNCYIPFDYESVLNYNPINEVNTIVGYNPQYSILIKNPGCPKQVLLGKISTSKIRKY